MSLNAQSQFVVQEPITAKTNIANYISIANTGDVSYSIQELIEKEKDLHFKPVIKTSENIGFTKDNIWAKLKIKNNTNEKLHYYLEVTDAVIDSVTFYTLHENGTITTQFNGDNIPFNKKSVYHRKILFKIDLQPKSLTTNYIHIKSDGEALKLPLKIIPIEELTKHSYNHIFFHGLFYGLFFLAAIVYFFFYLALRDKVFLWYVLYLFTLSMGLFARDGFFHQYITPNGGWLNEKIVLFGGNFTSIFFVTYVVYFLKIHESDTLTYKFFNVLRTLVFINIVGIILIPEYIFYAYPITNIIAIVSIFSILSTVFFHRKFKKNVDTFFALGICFLAGGLLVMILNKLNILPESVLTENSAEFGAGLEVVFLSISMANRIKLLKQENEKNLALSLQKTKDMNDLKNFFLSNLSHELRTPINSIMALSSALIEEKENAGVVEKAQLIRASSKSLLSSVNDIVSFAEIEKGVYKLNKAPLNLHETLYKVQRTIAPRVKNKKLLFEFPEVKTLPKHLIGDGQKLTQILTNLLDNAVKFTSEGNIALRIKHTDINDTKLRMSFYIRDTGIGIDDEKMNTIFESFTKHSSNDQREFEGLGLGLFIAKTCVDLQNGSIDIRKNSDGGTTCKVVLELEKEINTTASDEIPPTGTRILLVEDNKMNQAVIKLFAKKWEGTSLYIAENGEEGIDFLQKNDFDIVLMDLQMPVMDGFEAIEKIRNTENTTFKNVPILVLTADCTTASYDRCMNLGANDYMTKPIDSKLLLQKINTLINQHQPVN